MTLQIDPAYKSAWRESQGQPVDAKPRTWGDKDDDLSAAVLASHPVNSKRHDTYERASALVALVNHLLIQADHADKDARIAELIAETHDLGNEICGLNDTVDNLNGNLDRLSENYRIVEERAETWMRALTASRAECEGLRANLAAEEKRSAVLLKRLDKAREGTEPDYCYDPDEWEFTSSWDERDQVHGYGDNLPLGGVMQVATLIRGPRKWVANVPVTWDEDGHPDDTQIQWFDTEEEARAALSQKETGDAA